MTDTLSFPGLGLELDVNRVAFTLPDFLGGLPIYWYGIIIALGLLIGVLYFFARTKEFAVDPDRATDVLLVAIICAVIGARLYYVAFSWDAFKDNLISIFYIRDGGIAIYGCIIGAMLSTFLMCKVRKVKFLPMMDLASGSLLLGQAIGRWGNFVNVEAFGSNTTMPWGMTSRSISAYLESSRGSLSQIGVTVDPAMPVHPTFLYESLWCLAGFLFLFFLTKRRRFDGQLTLMYLGWYGLGRFFIEGLRTDSLLLGTIRVSQLLALLCFLTSVLTLVFILSKIRREGDSAYLQLYRDTVEGKLVLAGEFYKKPAKKGETAADESEEPTADDGEEPTGPTTEESATDKAETEESPETDITDEEETDGQDD
jgi:phosphatidylglycerol:prolipoprotein diacylglycerol transferase